jgi:transcriptional regulator with GAF, ATPase, and Fis domain
MQVWAGVSSLLQQVHEADDPAAALRSGCRWTREYAGADFVAILSHDLATVVACEPAARRECALASVRRQPETPPANSVIVESMRYGGVRVGSVILGGEPRDAAEARAVVAALAIACAPALRARLDDLALSGAGETLGSELLGVSPAMRALRDAVARAAGSTFPVLIEGESGTGKELVARALHRLSPRRDRRWAAVNCAALTDELLESELFGHTRGAFTGAMQPRVGLLEDAHEGTLFLDEVGELSPRGQAKLLRVLQEGEIRRVGENVSRRVDVRLVAATNRPLAAAAKRGDYREDLMFRLAVIRLRVPPLRDRIEDVPLLAHAFWRTAAARAGTHALLGPDAVAGLCRSSWPGNVRELQNAVAALAVGGPSRGRVGARHVAVVLAERSGDSGVAPPLSLAAARGQADRRIVAASLARHGGRQAAAARELGVSRQGLAKLIARLQVSGA